MMELEVLLKDPQLPEALQNAGVHLMNGAETRAPKKLMRKWSAQGRQVVQLGALLEAEQSKREGEP